MLNAPEAAKRRKGPSRNCPRVGLDYWQHLNHDFREHYRAHRETEESVMQASWETVNPDQRTWWQRYRKAKRIPTYVPSPKRPITYPAFEPTETQCENMNSLLDLMTCADYPNAYTFEVAELYRELGRFAEAKAAITQYPEHDIGVREKLLERLINEGQSAPVRYRI